MFWFLGDTARDNFYDVECIHCIGAAADVSNARRFYGDIDTNTAVVAKKLGLDVGFGSCYPISV